MRYIVVVLFLAFDASVAFGMVYSWIDSLKIRHFVNKEYDIPERYRSKVKALYPEANDSRTVPSNSVNEQPIPGLHRPPVLDQQEKAAERLKEETAGTAPLPKNIAPDALMKRGKRQRLHTGEE